MSKIKLQHYVPRFYLRNFSTFRKGSFYLNCFDKKDERTIPVNIRNIGGENYFYDTQPDTNQIIEKTLGKLESKFNASYEKIIRKENIGSLIQQERRWIAFFVVTQLLRTRLFRDILTAQRKQFKEFFLKEKLTPEFEKKIRGIDDAKTIKEFHIKFMINAPTEFVPILMKMKWCLIVNKTKLPFWTSDHPITMHNPVDMGPWSGLGLKMKGIQLHFPLTPRLMLYFGDPESYKHFPSRMEMDNEENLIHENWLQVVWSRRHLFSIDDNFSLATEILQKNQDLKDPDRERTTVQTLDKSFKDYYKGNPIEENPFEKFKLWDEQ